jgi:hypothetical protein
MDLRKSKGKIFIYVALVSVVCLISFFVAGYYSASKLVSYLPFVDTTNLSSLPSGANKIELKNSWFVITVDESGNLNVMTPEGEIILSALAYFSSYEGINDTWGLKNISVQLSNDSTICITGSGSSNVSINESFTIHDKVPKVDVRIRTQYNSNVVIKREALIAKFDVPVTEVYLKNRKVDSVLLDKEYWLQHQGVRFGTGTRSSLIYNTPHVSSLQLNTEENLLFINLDYSVDHPFIRIPFQKDGGGKWIDLSQANYSAGSERENYFSIYFGKIPQVIPRLMLVPYGYNAGYVFTEHADGGNIKTNRAAYFGDENISDINDAKGGFARYKIPVTKSVFYTDSTRNSSETSIFDDPKKPQFLDFLYQLYATGLYDICLHTPEDYNSKRESLIESIKFMKDNFDAKTWIDHGMYSGNLNRESFVCDGLNPESKYYAADLWEEYDTRYFWNPASEIIENAVISPSKSLKKGMFFKAYVDFWKHYLSPKEMKEMRFSTAFKELLKRHQSKGELNSLRSDKGNAYPTPLYWKHPTYTRDFYSWTTDYVKDYGRFSGKKGEQQFLNEQKQLDKLLTGWGVFINHGYYVRNRKDHNIFNESNGRIVISPFFDKVLDYMSGKRDSGELYLTTIRDLLDYWVLTDNVTFIYMPDGKINVFNLNDKPIKGLSLALHAKNVWLNSEIPKSKHIDEDTVIWFDIPAKSGVTLQVEL